MKYGIIYFGHWHGCFCIGTHWEILLVTQNSWYISSILPSKPCVNIATGRIGTRSLPVPAWSGWSLALHMDGLDVFGRGKFSRSESYKSLSHQCGYNQSRYCKCSFTQYGVGLPPCLKRQQIFKFWHVRSLVSTIFDPNVVADELTCKGSSSDMILIFVILCRV